MGGRGSKDLAAASPGEDAKSVCACVCVYIHIYICSINMIMIYIYIYIMITLIVTLINVCAYVRDRE